jgi:hypothetical protein
LTRQPNFFLVGTTKGGTSTLHRWLSQHPDTSLPARKELHFFCACPEKLKSAHDWNTYIDLFGDGTEKVVGEASPCYLYYPTVARAIAAKVPEAKILISLRDPVDRFWSHYLMNQVYRSNYPQPSAILSDWETRPPLLATDDLVGMGFYGKQLARFAETFDEQQIKVIFLEELTDRPEAILADVLAFLSLDWYPIDVQERDKVYVEGKNAAAHFLLRNATARKIGVRLLPTRIRRFVKYEVLGRSDQRPAVPAGIVGRLRDIYREDSIVLEESLQRPLPWSWHRT